MVRYNSSGIVVSRVTGNFNLYGKGYPPEVLKIIFSGSSIEYRYDLIRDGFGIPSVLIDGMGRQYSLCKIFSNNSTITTEEFNEKMKKEFKDMERKSAENKIANKRYADKIKNETKSLNSFVGHYKSEKCGLYYNIFSIPYTKVDDEEVSFYPNEKKSSLRLEIIQNGKKIFDGISIYRDVGTYSWTTFIYFKQDNDFYAFQLDNIKGGCFYKYLRKFNTSNEPYFDSIFGSDCIVVAISKDSQKLEKIVNNPESNNNLLGTFKSLHPSVKLIEIYREDNHFVLKKIKNDDTIELFESRTLDVDTIYFISNTRKDSPAHVLVPIKKPDGSFNTIKLTSPTGQTVRFIK